MPELERELRALALAVELPAERDLTGAVRARLAEQPRRLRGWRTGAAVAAALLVVSIGATMAVPDARTAVLRWFGLTSVTVIRVDELPPASSGPGLFGQRVTLEQAERTVRFDILLPDLDGPMEVRIDPYAPEVVVLFYGRPLRLRLTEFRHGFGMVEKFATASQTVERVQVNGVPGIWVQGRHVVSELFGLPRLAGNVLLWEQDGLTLRLEGRVTREQALRIAESVG